MSGIRDSLTEMFGVVEHLQKSSAETARKAPRERAAIISQNRQRYVTALSKLHEQAKLDPGLNSKPELVSEFETRLGELRRKLGDLQVQWRMINIEADFDGYARDSAPVAAKTMEFVNWARVALV